MEVRKWGIRETLFKVSGRAKGTAGTDTHVNLALELMSALEAYLASVSLGYAGKSGPVSLGSGAGGAALSRPQGE